MLLLIIVNRFTDTNFNLKSRFICNHYHSTSGLRLIIEEFLQKPLKLLDFLIDLSV